MSNKPSDRILSFQIKRAIQAEELTDAQILELWEQTYVQRGTSGIEFARAVLALAAGAAPVPNAELAEIRANDPVAWRAWNSQHHCYDYGEAGETDPLGRTVEDLYLLETATDKTKGEM